MRWVIEGEPEVAQEPVLRWFGDGLRHQLAQDAGDGPATQVVWNLFRSDEPRTYRRRAQSTFVIGVTSGPPPESDGDVLRATYPLLVRTLANLLIYVVSGGARPARTYFVTLERGHYALDGAGPDYFDRVLQRVEPLAGSHLVIDNLFRTDLPAEWAEGNPRTEAIAAAGRRLADLDLLPAPFPIAELLPPRDFAHLKRMFQMGGLSYGNLSVREPGEGYWMSASGVDKTRLRRVGEEILLVRTYDAEHNRMVVSVPADVQPRRVSVDAIEHWMIYEGFPEVGAILHVHAWMEGIPSTEINYPCGTRELAEAVRLQVAAAPDPGHAVVGLKNHGLTITGTTLDEIFDRVTPRLLRQVPMQ